MQAAKDHGLEIALDIAFQASGDHPYLTEHPEWFRRRPDGTIQYAENPPKKYQDIYPFDFESSAWRELWEELKSVFLYWSEQGVHIFRVDNPHTKPFPFWEWVIAEIKREYPETLFLAEAFTRPKMLYRLAKLGFTQSYNYFAWRNTRWELTEYLTELTQTEVREYCGPNLWPNTPDILPESLQYGGRPAFVTRFILAATLGPSYGIYGPAFELMDNTPLAPGKEEYLNSEKFEIKQWNIQRADSLAPLIGRVNQVRRDNPAFQANTNLRFHSAENDQIIAFTKSTEDGTNQVLVVVNLDPHHKQSGFVNLPLEDLEHRPWPTLPGPRSAHRRALSLERPAQLRGAGSPGLAGPHLRHPASGAYRERFRLLRVTLIAIARTRRHGRAPTNVAVLGRASCCSDPGRTTAAVCGSRFDTDRLSRTCFDRTRPRPTPTRQHCAG